MPEPEPDEKNVRLIGPQLKYVQQYVRGEAEASAGTGTWNYTRSAYPIAVEQYRIHFFPVINFDCPAWLAELLWWTMGQKDVNRCWNTSYANIEYNLWISFIVMIWFVTHSATAIGDAARSVSIYSPLSHAQNTKTWHINRARIDHYCISIKSNCRRHCAPWSSISTV